MTLLTQVQQTELSAMPDTVGLDTSLVLQFDPVIRMDDDRFFEFCQINRHLRIERTAQGEVIIMPPAGGETGSRNANLTLQVGMWAKRNGTGVAFDSSVGFTLPNGATRSPDASWVLRMRLAVLSPAQKTKFLPLCPDFAVELASPSDSLSTLRTKMAEYIANGAQLAWLLLPETHTVHVYRPNVPVEVLPSVGLIKGDPVLPGFTLDLSDIWEPGF